MKNELMKKARLAGAVALAATTLMVGTIAQADSLLAPLIINTGAGANSFPYSAGPVSTYLNVKVKGKGGYSNDLHYVWIKKGTAISDLFNLNSPCKMTNNWGKSSKADMVFQDTNRLGSWLPSGAPAPGEASTPNAYSATDFVGMLVISDVPNVAAGHNAPEGDMSGFAYIVDESNGDVVEYKLLNNHRSAQEGDFSAGFTSKHVVDLAWMSARPASGVRTGWTTMVTGPDMAWHSGAFNSSYDATVLFSQNTRPGESSPLDISGGTSGVYDNDEKLTSGSTPMEVTCMGSFTRSNFLDPQQLLDTRDGGWIRKSIIPLYERTVRLGGLTQKVKTNKTAKGAMVYRDDVISVNGFRPRHTMLPETSGHLAKGANHANRPN